MGILHFPLVFHSRKRSILVNSSVQLLTLNARDSCNVNCPAFGDKQILRWLQTSRHPCSHALLGAPLAIRLLATNYKTIVINCVWKVIERVYVYMNVYVWMLHWWKPKTVHVCIPHFLPSYTHETVCNSHVPCINMKLYATPMCLVLTWNCMQLPCALY